MEKIHSFSAKSYFIGTWLECRIGRLSFVELTRLLYNDFLPFYHFNINANINIFKTLSHFRLQLCNISNGWNVGIKSKKIIVVEIESTMNWISIMEVGLPHFAIKWVKQQQQRLQPLSVTELGFPHLAIEWVWWRSLKESLVGRIAKHGDLDSK